MLLAFFGGVFVGGVFVWFVLSNLYKQKALQLALEAAFGMTYANLLGTKDGLDMSATLVDEELPDGPDKVRLLNVIESSSSELEKRIGTPDSVRIVRLDIRGD